MPRQILMMTTSFPHRAEGDLNTSFVHALAKEIAEMPEFEVTVLTPHCPGLPSGECFGKIKIARFKYFFPSSMEKVVTGTSSIQDNLKRSWLAKLQLPFFLFFFWIAALRHGRKADLIHCHWLITGFLAVLGRIFFRRPIVVTAHHFGLTDLPRGLARFTLERVDALITAHPELAEKMRALSGRPVETVHNLTAIDLAPPKRSREEIRRSLNLPADAPVALYAGRLSAGKDPQTLLRAVPLILKDFPRAKFLIAGDGPMRAELEQFAAAQGIAGSVVFLGFRHDTPELFHSADVFISTNKEDNALTLSIIESIRSGAPCVLSGLPAISSLFESGKNAFVFPIGDERALARAVSGSFADPEQRRQMAESARALLCQLGYDKESIIRRMRELYLNILK